MKNFWLDRKKSREAMEYWNEFADKRKILNSLKRFVVKKGKKMRTTRDLLKETFAAIPNSFAYREVRFYVYQALQKLDTLEKREAARKKSWLEDKQKEDENKKSQNWMPPIYQSPSQVQQTLDILDKMIGEEKKVIENINAKKAKKGQVVQQEDDDEDNEQTFHG